MNKKQAGTATAKGRTLDIAESNPSSTHDGAIAEALVAGVATNATTVTTFSKGTLGEVDLTETFRALHAGARTVNSGDLSGVEAMLSSQMVALNAIFGELARRAALNMGEYINAADRYMRLALRAQSQCRATAETLAVIKAGPPIFARQANVAHGPQQVNNGVPNASGTDPRACEQTASGQPELLESSDGERLDPGTTGAAGGGDPTVEAVGAEHRPEDAGREG
jgi:hypothetical protein